MIPRHAWWPALVLVASVNTGTAGSRVEGVVTGGGHPLGGAVVRVQATELAVSTDDLGRFALVVPDGGRLTAWSPGFYSAGPVSIDGAPGPVAFELVPIPEGDDPDYRWLAALQGGGHGEDGACVGCHSGDGSAELPVDQWLDDAHSRSATNPRFLSMYDGSDLDGKRSPATRRFHSRDYGTVRLPPDRSLPYYGPGYVLDFPSTRGSCGACHVPAAAVRGAHGVDPRQVAGTEAEGVTCDVCHKIWDVVLDESTGLPFPERPGVLSIRFRRPPAGHQVFVGPFDDVAPGEDTRSDLQRVSRICAPCHFGTFWGVEVYGSFREWLESSYADEDFEGARTCQDCHMPRGRADHFARLDRGGLRRDPGSIASHRMPGASDAEFLRTAATLKLDAWLEDGGSVRVEATVTNSGAGHHLPTDSPLRQVLLVVSARDASGSRLEAIAGPALPDWAGPDAGRPGVAYAKILEEVWTGVAPTGAYWNPTRVVVDSRLPALASDLERWSFAGANRPVTVEARLVLRRAYWELARQKGWMDPDLEMARSEVCVPDGGLPVRAVQGWSR